jgi:hypothetical protein
MRKNSRFERIVKLVVLAALLLPAGALAGGKLSAEQIMAKASESRKLDGSKAKVSLTLYDGGGKAGEPRVIKMVTKMYDGGKTEKKLFRFTAPADIKGTGILTYDYEKKDDDMWLFLPALRKTRRIMGGKKSGAFMGSEFSYADMNTPVLSNYKLKILKEEKEGGVDCWVIEALPKSKDIADEEGYSKKVYWIGKPDYMVRKTDFYDQDGKLLKVLTTKGVKLVDKAKKRYRLTEMVVVNKQNKRKSVFKTMSIENAPDVKDEYFTTAFLERP